MKDPKKLKAHFKMATLLSIRFTFLCLLMLVVTVPLNADTDVAEFTFITLAGPEEWGPGAVDGVGQEARFNFPYDVVADSTGNVYVADFWNHTIRKMGPDGLVTTLAGKAEEPGSEDGMGSAARFRYPTGVAVDAAGNVYVADSQNHTIRKIEPCGLVSTVAGLAESFGTADGTGSMARFNGPYGVAVDKAGNVFVADSGNHTIRKIGLGAVVTTVAGLAEKSGRTDGIGNAARFDFPRDVAVDEAGNVYVADQRNNAIRKVDATGVVTTVAGWAGPMGGSADGVGSKAQFYHPTAVAVDGQNNIYVADFGNHTIRKIGSGRLVTTIAGKAGSPGIVEGAGGTARFNGPIGVTVDSKGNVFVADEYNHSIRKIEPNGLVTTVAGQPWSAGSVEGTGNIVRFFYPYGIAVDGWSNVYVGDSGNHTIRKIGPNGEVTTMAGLAGSPGSADGTNNLAQFNQPGGLTVDGAGNIFVADQNNHTIRKISSGGAVTTIAGLAGNPGSADGVGQEARFNYPRGVAVDNADNVYVADTQNYTIRKISPEGMVTTLAGLAGDYNYADGIGSQARFKFPIGMAVDPVGNVYVADSYNHIIRKISPDGLVTTLAGLAGQYEYADGTGSEARFRSPSGLAVDYAGNVYVADTDNHAIRRIEPSGLVTTVTGKAQSPGSGDGASSIARFCAPNGVAVDRSGNVYVADSSNDSIRRGMVAAPDKPIIDRSTGLVGAIRQLDVTPKTATNWFWRILRRPTGSTAELSSTTVRNPNFTPDLADLFVFQLRATNSLGQIAIRNLEFYATLATNVRIDSLSLNHDYAELTFMGNFGTRFRIQTVSNLNEPDLWQNLAILTLTNTIQVWTDPMPTSQLPRFYRAIITP